MTFISLIFHILCYLAIGVLVIFAICVWVDASLKKSNKQARDAAMKVESQEPGISDSENKT